CCASIRRNHNEWMMLGQRITDIRAGIEAALDPAEPDDGKLLRSALRKHMLPKHVQRHEKIQIAVEKRRAEEATKAKADVDQAAKEAIQAKNKSHTTDQKAMEADQKAAAIQVLTEFRKTAGDVLITDLVDRYLKTADPSSDAYKYIASKSLKTIQN